jgi:uncharacterized RmlC-like cupin family protein
MALIIKGSSVEKDPDFEPPYAIGFGVNKKTVENSPITVARSVIPPGGRNQRHYHVNTCAAGFILKGRIRVFYGPDHDQKHVDGEAGDFFYFPKGEIHGQMNLSDTEPAELIACQMVGSKEETGTVFVEPPWE